MSNRGNPDEFPFFSLLEPLHDLHLRNLGSILVAWGRLELITGTVLASIMKQDWRVSVDEVNSLGWTRAKLNLFKRVLNENYRDIDGFSKIDGIIEEIISLSKKRNVYFHSAWGVCSTEDRSRSNLSILDAKDGGLDAFRPVFEQELADFCFLCQDIAFRLISEVNASVHGCDTISFDDDGSILGTQVGRINTVRPPV